MINNNDCAVCAGKINPGRRLSKYCSDRCCSKQYYKKNRERIRQQFNNWRHDQGIRLIRWTPDKLNTCKICGTVFHPPKNLPGLKRLCSKTCQRIDHGIYHKLWDRNHPKEAAARFRRYHQSKKSKRAVANRMHTPEYRAYNNHRVQVLQFARKYCPLYTEVKECFICNKQFGTALKQTVGHIFPVKTHPHLAYDANNWYIICQPCNSKMHTENLMEYCTRHGISIPDRLETQYASLLVAPKTLQNHPLPKSISEYRGELI